MRLPFRCLSLALLMLISDCARAPNAELGDGNQTELKQSAPDDLVKAMKAVEPFFEPMRPAGPNDWLASFNEPGQTFEQYINSNPTMPTNDRKKIYVLPLGTFDSQQSKIIDITAGYLAAFYGLPLEMLSPKKIHRPLRIKDSRTNPNSHVEQVRTGFILDDILQPILPADASALIAFTNEDLFPDESMNYVFGQASLENRSAVWSLYRLDDNANFNTFLRRTIKNAAHETGHMFSMLHCTKYECVMSGSNHMAETDGHPIDACPECM